MSKFVDPDQCSNANVKYQYPKDKNLKDKLPQWAIVFASMLVKIAFQKQGIVTDCDIVKASSNSYRQKQDHISTFVNEKVRKREGGKIKKNELYNEFKLWMDKQGGKIPKGSELYEYMDNKFTKSKIGWIDVEIIYSNDDEMEDFNDE
jgi:phage/plasmid-associated DNA primase